MPTSGAVSTAPQRAAASRVRPSTWRGAPRSSGDAGGQSGMGLPEMLPPGPVTIGARSDPVQAFGPSSVRRSVEWTGNSAVCRAGRRPETTGAGLERTGDMAHLTTAPYFAFCSLLSSTFFGFSSPILAHAWLPPSIPPCDLTHRALDRLQNAQSAGDRPIDSLLYVLLILQLGGAFPNAN